MSAKKASSFLWLRKTEFLVFLTTIPTYSIVCLSLLKLGLVGEPILLTRMLTPEL